MIETIAFDWWFVPVAPSKRMATQDSFTSFSQAHERDVGGSGEPEFGEKDGPAFLDRAVRGDADGD